MTNKIIKWLEDDKNFNIALGFVIIYGVINLIICLG